MTVHTRDVESEPLMEQLREWVSGASPDDLARVRALLPGGNAYPRFSTTYPSGFKSSEAYRSTLPDLQNGPASLIRGAPRAIQHVGISNFRLPIHFRRREGGDVALETSVTGTVSLAAGRKGINMSRVMRSFYRHSEETFSFEVMDAVLDDYRVDMEATDARLCMRLSYPMRVESLRSGLSGWQYYDLALEVVATEGQRRHILHLDYVYSSTCPCSLELSEHARARRGQLATPHSQRSVARLSAVLRQEQGILWFEDVVELCRAVVPTETQAMVKREDEQAFAELNAANPIFVEDAARLFASALMGEPRVGDFRILASHQESLHSHDAVSVLTEGETFAAAGVEPRAFETMIHRG